MNRVRILDMSDKMDVVAANVAWNHAQKYSNKLCCYSFNLYSLWFYTID